MKLTSSVLPSHLELLVFPNVPAQVSLFMLPSRPDSLGRGRTHRTPAPVKEAWGAVPGTDFRLKQKPQMGLRDRSDDQKLTERLGSLLLPQHQNPQDPAQGHGGVPDAHISATRI